MDLKTLRYMNQTNIRSAEADRTASCAFADKVTRCSLDFYTRHCPAELRASYKQTVVATILVRAEDVTGRVTLQVVSMGVGTKVLPYAEVIEQRNRAEGSVLIRDCHAEILARRGFVRYLYDQLSSYNAHTPTISPDISTCIFEPARTGILSRLKLKVGVTLHLYTSSQPCGNASIKRWAKCKPVQFNSSLSEYEYPPDPHARIQITQAGRKEGQVAVLVKKNNHAVVDADVPAPMQFVPDTSLPALSSSVLPDPVLAAPYIPAGTALAGSTLGNVATCSDKIARWSALGLQGSLLTALIEPVYLSTITVGRKFSKAHCERALCCRLQDFCYPPPVRKAGTRKRPATGDPALSVPNASVSFEIASAMHDNGPTTADMHTAVPTSQDGSFTVCGTDPLAQGNRTVVYRVHHPVMLSTSVKLNDGSIVTGCAPAPAPASVGSAEIALPAKVGASFDEPRCVCCYLTSAATRTCAKDDGAKHEQCVVEVIDGRTGILVVSAGAQVPHQGGALRSTCATAEVAEADGSGVASSATAFSSVCSQELRKAFTRFVLEGDAGYARGSNTGATDVDSCAADRGEHYIAWKRKMSDPGHIQAKNHLNGEPTLFA